MNKSFVKFQHVKTMVGKIHLMRVDGPLTADLVEKFSNHECNGLEWNFDESSLVALSALSVEGLTFLSLRGSKRQVDDSEVSRFGNVRFLQCLTRGKAPLDLSGLRHLLSLQIDDRPGLVLPNDGPLQNAVIYGNTHEFLGFASSPLLEELTVENRPAHTLSLRGVFPSLRSLWIRRGAVIDLDQLVSPALQFLSIEKASSSVFDFNHLKGFPKLKQVTIAGKSDLHIVNRSSVSMADVKVLTSGSVTVDSAS